MTMSTIRLAIASAAMGVVLAGSAAAQDMTLKLGHLANEDNSWHKGALKFAEEVEARTDGRIVVEVYPNESLGSDIDVINGMQLGTTEMGILGENLQNWAPMAALMGLPYAYESNEEMEAVITGEIGDRIEQQIIERAGVRPLSHFIRGPRNLTSNRPIAHPDELNGLRIRVPAVPVFVDFWRAEGASPTPMAFSEVFTSLQNGTIDAQENPLALIQSANFAEVQDYVNVTEHVRSWIYIAVAEMTWNQLSEEDKAIFQEAAEIASQHEREIFLADEERLRQVLQDRGMEFVEADQAAFAALARDAVIGSVNEEIRPVVEELFNN